MLDKKDCPVVKGFLGAITAEICCNLLKNPFEVMKQNLQVGSEPTLGASFSYIKKTHGFRGFYIGLNSLLLREIPFSCVQMPLYELIKMCYISSDRSFLELKHSLAAGFIAGSIAGMLTNPIDVVKTNIMTQRELIYSGVIDCGQKLYKSYGVSVFSKGLSFRVMVAGGNSAFFFSGYELFMAVFNKTF